MIELLQSPLTAQIQGTIELHQIGRLPAAAQFNDEWSEQ
jgi:hypothetical protein